MLALLLLNSKLVSGNTNHAFMKTNPRKLVKLLYTTHTFSYFTFQCIDQIRTSSNHDTDKLLITKES